MRAGTPRVSSGELETDWLCPGTTHIRQGQEALAAQNSGRPCSGCRLRARLHFQARGQRAGCGPRARPGAPCGTCDPRSVTAIGLAGGSLALFVFHQGMQLLLLLLLLLLLRHGPRRWLVTLLQLKLLLLLQQLLFLLPKDARPS